MSGYRHTGASTVRPRFGLGKTLVPPNLRARQVELNGATIRILMRGSKENAAQPRVAPKTDDRSTIAPQSIAEPEPLMAYAARVGAQPGRKLDEADTHKVIDAIVDSAVDLFGSRDAAVSFLNGSNFGTNQTANDLVAAGRVVSVIARLNELRFGSNG